MNVLEFWESRVQGQGQGQGQGPTNLRVTITAAEAADCIYESNGKSNQISAPYMFQMVTRVKEISLYPALFVTFYPKDHRIEWNTGIWIVTSVTLLLFAYTVCVYPSKFLESRYFRLVTETKLIRGSIHNLNCWLLHWILHQLDRHFIVFLT